MAEGFSARAIDGNETLRTNTFAVDGVRLYVAVLRSEDGTQVVVDAEETRPGYLQQSDRVPRDGTTLQLHEIPYDPKF